MQELAQKYNVECISAPPELCTDNGIMIAWMAWELINAQ